MTSTLDDPVNPSPPPRRRGDRVRTAVRSFGEVLITVGVVLLLFVVYEVYWTDVVSAGKQAAATDTLNQEWARGDNPLVGAPAAPSNPGTPVTPAGQERTNTYSVVLGDGFAKLHIPSFGADYQFTILQGTGTDTLATGPGHYEGTAFPGQSGNFSVAGHRVGKGAPFNDLDLLQSCDAIVVETAEDWYVYRVLPMADEVAGWEGGRGRADASCRGVDGESGPVVPLGGDYAGVVGREVVDPSQSDVIAPVPDKPGATPAPGNAGSLLTLTTCTPRYSAEQRMIIHAVLVRTLVKSAGPPGQLPPELKEG
ncbi:MAG: class E sortase [Mycobacteriaceae bacterium]